MFLSPTLERARFMGDSFELVRQLIPHPPSCASATAIVCSRSKMARCLVAESSAIPSPNVNNGAFTDITDPALGGKYVRAVTTV